MEWYNKFGAVVVSSTATERESWWNVKEVADYRTMVSAGEGHLCCSLEEALFFLTGACGVRGPDHLVTLKTQGASTDMPQS